MIRKAVNFEVVDFVVACLRPKRPLTYSFIELHACAISPYLIFNKLESVAHELDLRVDLSINSIFNVDDLTFYRGIFEPPCLPPGASVVTQVPTLLSFPCAPTCIG